MKAIFFDWSGTLADDLGPVIEATNAVLTNYGLDPMDRETFREQFRLPYTEFYDEVLPDIPLDELETIFRQAHAASTQACIALPEAEKTLQWCRDQGLKIYLCSSVHEDGWQQQARELKLHHYFDHAHTGVRDKTQDFPQIVASHNLNPQDCLFLGDMRHDIHAAHAAQVPSIALTHGYETPQKLQSAHPHYLCDHLAEARGIIQALLRQNPTQAITPPKNTPTKASTNPANDASLSILGLQLSSHLGVPETERAQAQVIELDLRYWPKNPLPNSSDHIEHTIDYAQVTESLRHQAAARPRQLIERLGHDLADHLLAHYPIAKIQLKLRKHILPHTRAIQYTLTKQAP